MSSAQQIFLPFRLVAQFADGQRLYFDGMTEEQAQELMEAAQSEHGDIAWYDGVTDKYYENGKHHQFVQQPPEITIIDLTDYDEEG